MATRCSSIEPARFRPARPFVLIHMAMTADGKIATANRVVDSFGSPRDQAHLYALRASADAVMCGARTVDAGEVDLGSGPARFRRRRQRRGLSPHPWRIVVSGGATVRPDADLFRRGAGPVVVLVTRRAPRRRVRRLRALGATVGRFGDGAVDLRAALRWLATRLGVRRLVCEGGGELNSAMLRSGLVDEVHLTVCPWVFGGADAPTIAGGADPAGLAAATRLELTRRRRVGGELFLVYRVRRGGALRRGGVNARPVARAARAGR